MEVTLDEFFDGHPRVGQIVSQVHMSPARPARRARPAESARDRPGTHRLPRSLRCIEKAAHAIETRRGHGRGRGSVRRRIPALRLRNRPCGPCRLLRAATTATCQERWMAADTSEAAQLDGLRVVRKSCDGRPVRVHRPGTSSRRYSAARARARDRAIFGHPADAVGAS